VRGLSIGEIARRLRRDHGNVQDRVVEVGRALGRGSAGAMSEPAKVFEDRASPRGLAGREVRRRRRAEVAIFSGPNTRQRALGYADWRYRDFEEVRLAPMPNAGVSLQK
jgi:hypothetical protein